MREGIAKSTNQNRSLWIGSIALILEDDVPDARLAIDVGRVLRACTYSAWMIPGI